MSERKRLFRVDRCDFCGQCLNRCPVMQLPIDEARKRVPVGLINPSKNRLAGALRGTPTVGVGNHWWYQLTPADFQACQLPNPTGRVPKPTPW